MNYDVQLQKMKLAEVLTVNVETWRFCWREEMNKNLLSQSDFNEKSADWTEVECKDEPKGFSRRG